MFKVYCQVTEVDSHSYEFVCEYDTAGQAQCKVDSLNQNNTYIEEYYLYREDPTQANRSPLISDHMCARELTLVDDLLYSSK
jgi:hypothetical protein